MNSLKRFSFFSLLLPFLSPLLAEPVLADGSFSPSTFIVTFYQLGFIDTNTGSRFEILNSVSGVEVDFANPGTATVLAQNVRPLQSGTYNAGYAVISNRYKLAGNDNSGCYIAAGNYTVGTVGFNWGYTSATNNPINAATSSNPAVLWENTYGFPFNTSYGPINSNVSSTANNNVISLVTYLTTAAQPTAINVMGAVTTRERVLYLGDIAQPILINSSSNGNITFTISATNSGQLSNGCTRFSFNGNIGFGMSVTTN